MKRPLSLAAPFVLLLPFSLLVRAQDVPAPVTAEGIGERLRAAHVAIEKRNAAGRVLGLGSGFHLAPHGYVLTAFHVIDGASSLRVTTGDKTFDLDSVLAWDRRHGYAVLRLPEADSAAALAPAAPGSVQVGERVFAFDPSAPDNPLVEGEVRGRTAFPELGERLSLSFLVHQEASGGALVNQHGEVVGLLQAPGTLLPGGWSVDPQRIVQLLFGSAYEAHAVGLPLDALRNPFPAQATPLAELARGGLFVSPLAEDDVVSQGTVVHRLTRRIRQGVFVSPQTDADSGPSPLRRRPTSTQPLLNAVDSRFEYRRADEHLHVFVVWGPRSKRQHQLSLRLYDLENRLRVRSKPSKLKLAPGDEKSNWWKISFDKLPAGLYRVDVLLDDSPVWRSFFRLLD
ncbi:MAG: trypsin-like peptidase domain-containing protein [Acidobacteria bacterium]|nr:trypsin-like peptidase domain-containing protein [Acidobacteriota bacterium]